MNNIKVFFNKILFETKLDQVKKEGLRSYWKDFFLVKNIFYKLLTLVLCLIICSPLFFCLRNNALQDAAHQPVFNLGAGFSAGNSWNQGVVYFVKVLISVVFLALGIFFNRWYIYIPSLIIGVNGWYNVIDKALVDVWVGQPNIMHYDAVVDYIHLAVGTSIASVANVADIFITIGVCLLVVGIIYYMVVLFKKSDEAPTEAEATVMPDAQVA